MKDFIWEVFLEDESTLEYTTEHSNEKDFRVWLKQTKSNLKVVTVRFKGRRSDVQNY